MSLQFDFFTTYHHGQIKQGDIDGMYSPVVGSDKSVHLFCRKAWMPIVLRRSCDNIKTDINETE
jgi:hypothetical protein